MLDTYNNGMDEENPADVRRMWRKLNRDREFNLRMGTLNLLTAAADSRYVASATSHSVRPYAKQATPLPAFAPSMEGLHPSFKAMSNQRLQHTRRKSHECAKDYVLLA